MTRFPDNAWNWKYARHFILGALLCVGTLPSIASQSVSLTWNPSPDATVVGYKIYYGGVSGVYTNTVALGAVTNVTVGGLTEGATYYFTATSVSSSGSESTFCNEASYAIPQAVPAPPAAAPTVDPVGNFSIYQNAGAQMVVVTNINSGLSDGNQNVSVSASSSNPAIIPPPSVSYSSGDNFATLSFAPAVNASGTATVTVTVNNGNGSNNITSETFQVTVTPASTANQSVATVPPTFDALTNITVYQNAGGQIVVLTNIDSGLMDGNQSVSISADTSDPTIIPVPTIIYTNGNNYGVLYVAPVQNASGTATVTVTVNNGAATNNLFSQTFTITVLPPQFPTLAPIGDLAVLENTGAQTVTVTGISPGPGNGGQAVIVSATSSNPSLIPPPTVDYTSPNSTATLTFAPTLNATGTATVTVAVNNGSISNNIITQTFTVTVQPNSAVNQPPTLDPIANLTMLQGAAQSITLTGISSGSPSERQFLRVTAISSNPRLLSVPMVRYLTPASTALLTLRPGTGTGTATVTVTVNDSGKSNNIVLRSFTVTVKANQPPTLDPIASVTIARNSSAQTITLTGITSGSSTENQNLRVSAMSGNLRLIGAPQVQYTSPANTAQLIYKPTGLASGTATITVTVNDGGPGNHSIRQRFLVTVTPSATTNTPATTTQSASGTVPPNAAGTLTPLASVRGQFHFHVDGISGSKYAVQATSDLVHWTTVETNTAPFDFQDTAGDGSGQRFYRTFYVR